MASPTSEDEERISDFNIGGTGVEKDFMLTGAGVGEGVPEAGRVSAAAAEAAGRLHALLLAPHSGAYSGNCNFQQHHHHYHN